MALDAAGPEAVASVIDLSEYRATVKTWTKSEMRALVGLLGKLRERQASYALHLFETDEGDPVACLVPREGRDATHCVSKSGRTYVLLNEWGESWKRSDSLDEIVMIALVP